MYRTSNAGAAARIIPLCKSQILLSYYASNISTDLNLPHKFKNRKTYHILGMTERYLHLRLRHLHFGLAPLLRRVLFDSQGDFPRAGAERVSDVASYDLGTSGEVLEPSR